MNRTDRRDPVARTVTTAILLSIFVYSFVNTLVSVVVNDIVDAFSLTGAAQGMTSSMINVGLMLALIATPFIQGRVRKLTVVIFAGALQAVMLAACGLSPVFSLFCGCCVLLGMGGGLVDTYSNSTIVDVNRKDSAKYLGYLHGLFGIGSLLAPLLFRALLTRMDWRGVFFVLAGMLGAATIVVFGITRKVNTAGTVTATEENKLRKEDVLEYIRNRRNLVLVLAGAFASATQTGIMAWIVRYMTLRFDAEALGAFSITVYWVCATVCRFLVSRVKVRPMKLFLYGALVSALLLAAGVLSNSAVVMCVMMGAVGFTSGHLMPVLFGESAVGYEGKTTFTTSVLMMVMGVVRVLIPLFIAYISTAMSVVTGMLVPAVTGLLAALFALWTIRVSNRRTAA